MCLQSGYALLPSHAHRGASSRLTRSPHCRAARILCKKTDTLVGYLYRWNNGDLQPACLDTAKAEVRYEPISAAA